MQVQSQTIGDLLEIGEDVGALILEAYGAALNSENEWEINFTSDMSHKFHQFGLNMFISEKQLSVLKKIAGYAL